MTPNPLIPELSVSDVAVSLRFYTAVLGFREDRRFPELLDMGSHLARGGVGWTYVC